MLPHQTHNTIQHKKGVSIMVSYALLVVIAVAIGAIIYPFLKLYLPSERVECEPDVALVVSDFACDLPGQSLYLEIENRGLFTVDAAFIRFGESSRTVRRQINPGSEIFNPPLIPGESRNRSYAVGNIFEPSLYNYIVEIQPAIISQRTPIPCEGVIITQEIRCQNESLPAPGGTYEQRSENPSQIACDGTWNATDAPCANATDGQWDTYAEPAFVGVDAFLYVNYSLPVGLQINKVTWEIKGQGSLNRVSITLSPAHECWRDPLQFMVRANWTTSNRAQWNCYNGTDFITLRTENGNQIYEEAIIWEVTAQ